MAFDLGAVRERTDGQLLERFATERGEGAELAFAALVERHGPMVLRVARGILADPHDADDAFQATFLVLVARARGLWVRDSLGPWLHQVAHRTASCHRASAGRRRRLDRRVAIEEKVAAQPDEGDDRARVLHEEINRLPERYRAPVILCDLEGRTHEQAARALGWPVGTVKSRQARARDRLRDRLTRRGVAPGLAGPLLRPGSGVTPSIPLVQSTTVAAVRLVSSRAIAPGTAAALAREVITAMKLIRSFQAASVVVVALGTASGVGLIAQEQVKQANNPPPAATQARPRVRPPIDPPTAEVKPGKLSFTLSERGAVEAAQALDVINEVEGNSVILRIIPEGAHVRKGDVVAELDSATLRDTLTNQRITTQQAEASSRGAGQAHEVAGSALKEYAEGVAPQELAAVQAKITRAEAGIAKGKARLARTRAARQQLDDRKTRITPETPPDVAADLAVADRLDDAELNLQDATTDLAAAQAEEALLQKYTRARTTRHLESEVELAQANALSRKSSWDLQKIREAKLERQIQRCTLRAPGDGMIIYANDPRRTAGPPRLQIEEGATIRERQKIFSVVDLDGPMRVNAKVHESLVDQVLPGQTVRIKVEAIPDQVVTGVVRSVAPMADVTAFNTNGVKVYTTMIQINDRVPNLRPGMTAAVDILLFDLDNVLTIPITAVVQIDDQDQVAVRTPTGAIEWRAVTLGRSNREAVQVKQGLQPGDRVLLDRRRP